MTYELMVRWSLAGALLVGGMVVAAKAADTPATAPAATATPATAPTTRPGDETLVLVRVGDKGTITQMEFNSYFFGGPPVPFETSKEKLMRELVERKLLSLYLDDHPEIDPAPLVKTEIEEFKKTENITTDEEFRERVQQKMRTSPEALIRLRRLQLAQGRLVALGEKEAADEELMKKLFDAQPAEFNGTEMDARHILIGVAAYDTPEEKKAKRERAEKIRQDLLAGKVTWEDAVKESVDISRAIGGRLGTFTRHDRLMEDLAAVAFQREVNQIGDVVETLFGYHILQVTRRAAGNRSFEDSRAEIKKWLRRRPYLNAIHEAAGKYPVVGVQPPLPPVRPPWLAAATSRPGGKSSLPGMLMPAPKFPTTRPGGAGAASPAALRPGVPAMPPRPTTRPVVGAGRVAPGGSALPLPRTPGMPSTAPASSAKTAPPAVAPAIAPSAGGQGTQRQ